MKAFIVMFSIVILCGCASNRQLAHEVPQPVTKERLIPIYLAPDSSWLKAYFECDSNNRVLLKQLENTHTPGMNTDFSFNGGLLNYTAGTSPDTVYLPAKDSLIYIPVPGEPMKENYVSIWQSFWIVCGKLGAAWLVLSNLPRIFKWIKTTILKIK